MCKTFPKQEKLQDFECKLGRVIKVMSFSTLPGGQLEAQQPLQMDLLLLLAFSPAEDLHFGKVPSFTGVPPRPRVRERGLKIEPSNALRIWLKLTVQ